MAIEGDRETDKDYLCSIRPAESDRITREYSSDISEVATVFDEILLATLSRMPQQVRYCYTCWRPGHFSADCSHIPKHERELIAKRRADTLKNRPRQETHTRDSGSSSISDIGPELSVHRFLFHRMSQVFKWLNRNPSRITALSRKSRPDSWRANRVQATSPRRFWLLGQKGSGPRNPMFEFSWPRQKDRTTTKLM
jgi:hypothetical protein